jgi:hypothetical protein
MRAPRVLDQRRGEGVRARVRGVARLVRETPQSVPPPRQCVPDGSSFGTDLSVVTWDVVSPTYEVYPRRVRRES